jgi:methionine aminotransferase
MTEQQITSKLPDVGTSIFTVMSAMAAEYGADNLSQGFPEFDPDPWLKDRVNYYIQSGHNQYAPMMGTAELRQAIRDKLIDYYGQTRNADTEITITSGATEAIFAAIHCAVSPGDEVIMFDPSYDCYDPVTRLAGGIPVHIPMDAVDFSINWASVQKKISPRTRMIIINSPHNPSGATLTTDDLNQLAECIRGRDILVLSDEVYEHIIFDDLGHASVLKHPELKQRSFVVSSFGKTYHMTGWKIGYCVASPELTTEFRRLHQFITFSTTTPMQLAIADMMREQPDYGRELASFYEQKRDVFVSSLQNSRFRILPCSGTYFQLLDYSAISDEEDMSFSRWLTTEKGIATIPISPFCEQAFEQRYIRCCFAKSEETLRRVGEKLSQL